MAEVRASAKSLRISPRKTRLVVDLIRGKKVGDAIAILHNCESPVKNDVLKVLNSAIANANDLNGKTVKVKTWQLVDETKHEVEKEKCVNGEIVKVKVMELVDRRKHIVEEEKVMNFDLEKLFVKEILVDQGATLKRFRPRAKGSGNRILKRTSHITIVVSDGLE